MLCYVLNIENIASQLLIQEYLNKICIYSYFWVPRLLRLFPVFLFSPIFLIHWAVQCCGRQLRPELLQMVNARGNLTAASDGRKRRSFGLILEGCPSKEQLLKEADLVIFWRRNKLTQSVTKWMGFLFWEKVENFDITDHVKYNASEDQMNYEQAKNFMKNEHSHNIEHLWQIDCLTNFVPPSDAPYAEEGKKYSLSFFSYESILFHDNDQALNCALSLISEARPRSEEISPG
jgi:hypothetical protein